MPTIEEYLQMLQADPAAMKQAQMSGLLGGMGMGLLSAPGWRGVSNMGMGGYQGAMDARMGAQQAGYDKLKQRQLAQGMAGADMDFAAKQQAADDETKARTTLQNFQMPSPLPSMSPTPQNAQALAQTPKAGLYEQLMAKADALESQGLIKQAAPYRAEALKVRAKFDTTPRMGTDPQGNRYAYVLDDQGNEKRLGAGPDKEKLHFSDAGGRAGVGQDVYSGQVKFGGVDKTMTPGERANDARARERMAFDKEGRAITQNTPNWVNDLDRGIQIDPRSGQSRPIMAGNQPVGAKGESKKAEAADSARSIIELAKPLIEKSTGSYAGAGWDEFSKVFGVSTDGATASSQLKVLQARLMTEQPRMEGPQSDRDVQLYREAAGQIGDPTVPNEQKQAALETISALNDRYTRKPKGGGATAGWSITPVR